MFSLDELTKQLEFDKSELAKIESNNLPFHEKCGVYWKNLKISIYNLESQISFIHHKRG
ncbi:MAG: hypothetical protein QG646_849 [Euryarchaeota archaeon]|nr:hypothetical protein [Euryarchaeota archaeon]